jgi:hypothetical protein
VGGTPSFGFAPAPSLPNTMPNSPAAPVVLPMPQQRAVSVNVYPLTATLDEAGLARELWRAGVLNGG